MNNISTPKTYKIHTSNVHRADSNIHNHRWRDSQNSPHTVTKVILGLQLGFQLLSFEACCWELLSLAATAVGRCRHSDCQEPERGNQQADPNIYQGLVTIAPLISHNNFSSESFTFVQTSTCYVVHSDFNLYTCTCF